MPEDYNFPEPTDDFSLLTLEEIRAIGTNHVELKSIRRSSMAAWIPIPGYPLSDRFFYVIGYGSKSRFLLVALNYDLEADRYRLNSPMKTKSKDFGAIKNEITGKTIREMSWEEILTLPAERLSHDEAMRRIAEARLAAKGKK